DLDLVEQAPRLEVPVYFFVGRHDVNAMPIFVEEYHDVLDAPRKELIWLEGGHGLGSAENTDRFVDVMLEQVRPLAAG
ncbi:alpha/beta hydrolase fold protein, partial [Dietzia cinnamea P4]